MAADNFRYAVVDLPADVPVLLVDGDPAAADARYLSRPWPRRQGADGHPAADRNAAVPRRQAAGPFPGDRPGQRRSPGPLGRRGPGAVTSATAAAWPSSSARSATAASSTSRSIATARGCFPCRWPARPNCWSIAWKRRPTWRWTPRISSSASSPRRGTASSTPCWWSGTSPCRRAGSRRPARRSRVLGPAAQRRAAGRRAELRQGAGGGDAHHRRAAVEQLGPQSQLRRRHAGLAGLPGRPARRRAAAARGQPLEVSSPRPSTSRRSASSRPTPTTRRDGRRRAGRRRAMAGDARRRPTQRLLRGPARPKPAARRKSAATRSTSMRPRATCGRCSAPNWPPGCSRRSSTSSTRRPRSSWPWASRPGYNLGEALLYLLVALLIGEQIARLVGQLSSGRAAKAAAAPARQLPRRRRMNAACCLAAGRRRARTPASSWAASRPMPIGSCRSRRLLVAIVLFVRAMYRRDAAELPPRWAGC